VDCHGPGGGWEGPPELIAVTVQNIERAAGRRISGGTRDPIPGDGEQLYEVSAAGINDADTHHAVS
jgi:hypothetical protein